jgi:sterol desaturase/sphingolipid hydroxylase (fatty acid hydroxylase superfamily)
VWSILSELLHVLKTADPLEVGVFFFLTNGVIFAGSVLLCWWLGVVFNGKRLFDRWEPLHRIELAAAFAAVAINAGVSVVGWMLWVNEIIVLTSPGFLRSALDCVLMVLAMDLGMYVFHRLAHAPAVYRRVHRFHHRHEATNPMSLFVLHPMEVAGFGALMILCLILLPMSFGGLISYLTLNVLFGTLGHCGVEPFPRGVRKVPLLRLIGTSTFHAGHHERPGYNFGFYTLLWDKIFGTLDPSYGDRFDQVDRDFQ